MAKLGWDRMLETCVRCDGEALVLAAGAPPQVRVWSGLRAMQVPPVEAPDLGDMLVEITPTSAEQPVEEFGYVSFDLGYGDDYKFRAVVFGGEIPTAAVLGRVPLHSLPAELSQAEPSAPIVQDLPIRRILDACVECDAYDVLLAPGSAPLLRSDRAFHAFRTPPLSAEQLRAKLSHCWPTGAPEKGDGYCQTDYRFSETHWFRFAVFGKEIAPTLAVLMARRV